MKGTSFIKELNLNVYFTNYSIVFTKDFKPVFTAGAGGVMCVLGLRVEILNDHALYHILPVVISSNVSLSRLFCENNPHAE